MKILRRFLIRLSHFTTRQSADQRLQEEIAEHLALQTEENLRAGMSPAEARRQAALKFGAAGSPVLPFSSSRENSCCSWFRRVSRT